ncbi:MAG TPA: tungsten ABC transporter substrate-binding protein [Dehalococcoidia bacterium]|nr:tungsten ABC transporter substrate-binding protein [Dehalococcoidia bacterium]
MLKKILYIISSLIIISSLLFAIVGCSSEDAKGETGVKEEVTAEKTYELHDPMVRFKIATTTSLYDTGLWYHLEPIFEELANVEMDIVYAGTGIALEWGKRGDVDAIIVHDRAREDQFIADGYGINRRNFGYNFFLIAGPEDDPAGIVGLSAAEAYQKIYDEGMKGNIKFVSRGDDSGTHAKEKLIWKEAGFDYEEVRNSGEWYVEAGKGMGPTLLMANEMSAYTMADISTFLAYSLKSDLGIKSLVEKDSIFINVYAAIAINPETHSAAKIDIANKFINWLISDEVQEIIGTYGEAEYGRSLFYPIAGCDIPGCPPSTDWTTPVPDYVK